MLTDIQKTRLERMFHAYDTNRDGFLTLEDMMEHVRKLLAGRGEGVDAKPLVDVLQGYWAQLSEAADLNRDGRVSLEEYMVFTTKAAEDLMQAAEAGAKWPYTGWVDSLYGIIDADGDGRISFQEYAQWIDACGLTGDTDTRAAFRGFDKNADGYLSREEFAVANEQFWLSPDASAPGHRLIGP